MTDHPLSDGTAATSWALNPWRPMSRPIDLKHLGKLSEELSEGGAAVARSIIQGIDESEPITRKPNREWLEDELADIRANIELVTEHFGLDQTRMAERAARKKIHLRGWHSMLQGDALLAYLATPYCKFPAGIHKAFEAACRITARLLLAGTKVYSPIAHTHPIATIGGIDPFDHATWMPFDEAMMRVCDVLIVTHMDSWEISEGIAIEVAYFEKAGRPIFDLDPDTLVMTRRVPG